MNLNGIFNTAQKAAETTFDYAGYVPVVGTVTGVARIALAALQKLTLTPESKGESLAYKNFKRGAIELIPFAPLVVAISNFASQILFTILDLLEHFLVNLCLCLLAGLLVKYLKFHLRCLEHVYLCLVSFKVD